MKALVRDPRPFMIFYDALSPECNFTYGNPSSASAYAGACFPGFAFLCFTYAKKPIIKILLIPVYFIMLALTVLVPYSRFHLSANSID